MNILKWICTILVAPHKTIPPRTVILDLAKIGNEIQAEVIQLKAVSADLLTTLEEIATLGEQGMKPDYAAWLTFHDKVAQIARTAIDKARKS